ncbi:MAG: 4Fe-4S dicluster domain-containing protein [Firmicutes bacterium]|nr:4Fe-4S dicluster domain-containing protein [Bacillota bacterium]MCL5039736.1 4Fe-4S dicluster domain-containing protein [Bacillota bacterium]
MAKYGMVIDLKRCVGCYSCVLACKAENGTPPGVFWNKVLATEKGRYPSAHIYYTPVACMHCDSPPCEGVCPTGATYKGRDGIVSIEQEKCIGCRYCQVSCPYDVRSFNERIKGYFQEFGLTPYEKAAYARHKPGTVSKCDFCSHRLEQGKEPACVVACPARARHFGDLGDPTSEVARLIAGRSGYRLREEAGTQPSVYYLPG